MRALFVQVVLIGGIEILLPPKCGGPQDDTLRQTRSCMHKVDRELL